MSVAVSFLSEEETRHQSTLTTFRTFPLPYTLCQNTQGHKQGSQHSGYLTGLVALHCMHTQQHCHSPVNLPSILESSTTRAVLTRRSVSLFLLDKPKAKPNQSTIKRLSSLKSPCFALISKKAQDNNRLPRPPVCLLFPVSQTAYQISSLRFLVSANSNFSFSKSFL